jgi:protein required for attachment to host cells
MSRTCIAVVDASRARLFTFDRTAGADGVHDQLVEQRDLVAPARRRRPSELFSDSGTASNRTGGLQYGFDDHRAAHVAAMDAEFARAVIDELDVLLRATSSRHLILCASPRMLGELREIGDRLPRAGLVIDELPRNLVKLTTPAIRDYLASFGLLPPLPVRPGVTPAM